MLPRDLQVLKAWKTLKERGEKTTVYKISQMTKIPQPRVKDSLKRLEKYPKVVEFVKKVKAGKYFAKDVGSPEMRALAFEAKKRLAEEGYYTGGKPPLGYKIKIVNHGKRVLEIDPEKAPLILHIFKGYKEGKSTAQLGREVGLNSKHVWKILRDPRYAGYVHFRDKLFLGKHKAIIDPELWRSIQMPNNLIYRTGHVPFGFKRNGGQFIKDSEAAKKVVQMFALLLEGKSVREISQIINLEPSTVWRMIKNPIYANKVEKDGKLIDAGVEQIIPFETWENVQKILRRAPGYIQSAQARKRRMNLAIQALYGMIKRQPATSAELKEITGYKNTKLHRYLRELRKRGLIEREKGKFGRFYVKDSALDILTD